MTDKKQTKPHLACDADLDKLEFPIMGLPKVDGVRMLHITGSATGRSLKPHGNLYVTGKYSGEEFCGLDGEVTFGDIRGESLCRDTTSVMSRIQGEPDVQWNIFDLIREDTINLPYMARYMMASDVIAKLNLPNVKMIPYAILENIAQVESAYEQYLNEGYEGLVLRSIKGAHKDGRATVKVGAYLRMKPQSDKEAVCIRLVEAQENLNEAKVGLLGRTERSSHKENKVGKGMVGMLVCKDCTTGLEIDVGAGKMTHPEREYYWKNPERIVGQFIKYKSMDVGVKDKPRFARFMCIRTGSDMS